jgi:hypothetical protein
MSFWTTALSAVIPSPCFERPLICRGLLSESQLIVIGENPATEMSENWWQYWDDQSGFDYDAFLYKYMKKRAANGKNISPTRRRLNRIHENGISCVETNAHQNEKPDGAGVGVPNSKIIALLIKKMPL